MRIKKEFFSWMCLFCTLDILECYPFIAVRFFPAEWLIVVNTTKRFTEFSYFFSISHSFFCVFT